MKKILNALVVLVILVAAWSCTPTPPEGTLKMEAAEFYAGDEIKVSYEITKGELCENSWIGIIPSATPKGSVATNDSVKSDSQTIKELKGELVFVAPETPGTYDFRLNVPTGEGFEVATISFTILEPKGEDFSAYTLTLSANEVKAGAEIKVTFKANPEWQNGWIGIIPSEAPHGDESKNDEVDVDYQYTANMAEGTLTFKAPAKAGSYDFRMHNTDNQGVEVTSVTFVVK